MNIIGYIYIRNHPSYRGITNKGRHFNVCKVGKTHNIPDRDCQYATGELIRGHMENVFEVSIEQMDGIERLLQMEFKYLNIKYDGGTELFDKKIMNLIEPYFVDNNITYRKLTRQEITDLIKFHKKRTKNNKNIDDKIIRELELGGTKNQHLIDLLKSHIKKEQKSSKSVINKSVINQISYTPRYYQTDIINKSVEYFQQYNKGLLVLICGVGKTLISLWITQKLNLNTILIGVPNKLLLEQWKKITCILFPNTPHLIVSDNIKDTDVMQFLENNNKKCIIINTYASSYKVFNATRNLRFIFDMKILDEVHHLTSTDMKSASAKSYIKILQVSSVKQLSLTATLKQIENTDDLDGKYDNIISNDSVGYFGEIIDRRCMSWAIEEKIICDYMVQTIIADEEQLEQQLAKFHIVEQNDKRLFLSAFATLQSITEGNSRHALIYANNKENSSKIIQYVKMLLDDNYFDISNLYYSIYHGDIKSKTQKEIIENFTIANFGIISCVYCLGEGWDFPLLDCVVFAENMTSYIRIVQSVCRASRKNNNRPDKIMKIILPVLNTDDWLEDNENSDFKKIKEVIYLIGLEDEHITQKITVSKIRIEKQKSRIDDLDDINDTGDIDDIKQISGFGEYDEELTQKLKLKTTKRAMLGISYKNAVKIIATRGIKNKKEYYALCESYIGLHKEPDVHFKGQFVDWIEYLSIERKFYDLETCKKKVKEYLLSYPELGDLYLNLSDIVNKLCGIDSQFPPNDLWIEYYKVSNLREIIKIIYKKKKDGC